MTLPHRRSVKSVFQYVKIIIDETTGLKVNESFTLCKTTDVICFYLCNHMAFELKNFILGFYKKK